MPQQSNSLKTFLLLAAVLMVVVVVGVIAVTSRVNTVLEEQTAAPQSASADGTEQKAERLKAGNLHIGDQMPEVELVNAAGEKVSLQDQFDGEHYVVLNFTHPDCPCAENCSELIGTLEEQGYDDVRVVGVLSHDSKNERVMKALQKQKDEGIVTYPVYYDPGHKAREVFGPERTPTVWVADKDGTIRYWGAPESTLFPGSEDHRYLLKEAIDAMRSGEIPEIQRMRSIGCLIGG